MQRIQSICGMATDLPPDLQVSALPSYSQSMAMLAFGAAVLLVIWWIIKRHPPDAK
jgi:hypothetical protein